MCATIAASFCAEPINVQVTKEQSINEAQPQKRAIGLSPLSDCDGVGHVGLHGGFNSDLSLHGGLALGLPSHGYASSYAPGYSGGYLASGGILASHAGQIGTLGHVGSLGAVVASPSLLSQGYAHGYAHGYAPHAPILASSVVSAPILSHPPVFAAPAVCFLIFIFI